MRTDIDVMFLGGPLGEVTSPIEKHANARTGLLEPPRRIPVGHLPYAEIGMIVIVDVTSMFDHLPMIGEPPEIGHYEPCGLTDNGRRAYIWHDA